MKTHILISIMFVFSFANLIQSQEKINDTLFFKLRDNYLYQADWDKKQFIIKNNYNPQEGAIYITQLKIITIPKPKKILCFKKYAMTSKLYIPNSKKLNEFKVLDLFTNHTVILITKKNEYVHVGAKFVIN
jgi:hypothetical protein